MRFKTDENLPARLPITCSRAVTMPCGWMNRDWPASRIPELRRCAWWKRRAIVTLDTDFMDIRRFPPEQDSGIVVLRPHRQTVPRIVALTHGLVALLGSSRCWENYGSWMTVGFGSGRRTRHDGLRLPSRRFQKAADYNHDDTGGRGSAFFLISSLMDRDEGGGQPFFLFPFDGPRSERSQEAA